jgi:hypothetical protein
LARQPRALALSSQESSSMRKSLLGALMVTWMGAAALAQQEPQAASQPTDEYQITKRAVKIGVPLRGAVRARYVIRQIDLTPEQQKDVWTTINTMFKKNPADLPLDVLMSLGAQLQHFQEQGDEQGVQRVQEQIKQVMEQLDPSEEFYRNLRAKLTPEQEEQLDQALARLRRNPEGALRPADLLRLARGLDLSQQQRRDLEDLKWRTARKASMGAAGVVHDEALRFRLVRQMIDAIRGILTPEQRERFDRSVDTLRVDLVPGIDRMDADAQAMGQKGKRGRRAERKPRRGATEPEPD